jgi:hypothetical protein
VQLYEVLAALGVTERERVSICTQLPGERFNSRLYEVQDLAGWSPPQDRNVWFGVNPVRRQVRYGRGTEADTTRVRALFADLDVKPGQFEALDACYATCSALARRARAVPVVVIESGHGIQPIWRVGSPRGDSNVVDRDRSRDEWKLIYQRWGAVVQNAAGCPIDNVYNLDRILRCPGSVNWKNPDEPVPVRTRVYEHNGRVRPRELVVGLDRDGVEPLARITPSRAAIPTSIGEADTWIHEQPGATLDLAELRQLPPSATLGAYFDVAELVEAIGDGDGAHATMRDKVMHAVFAAQEGRAGLALALNNIGEAYLAVMDARAAGRFKGEARDAATASRDWQSAVHGAVAKARARTLPNVDGWAVTLGDGAAPPRYSPAYKPSYRPRYRKRSYRPRYRKRWV